jgi:hypothetical protein
LLSWLTRRVAADLCRQHPTLLDGLADIYRAEIDHIFDEADLDRGDTADLLADVCQGPGSTPGSSGNP